MLIPIDVDKFLRRERKEYSNKECLSFVVAMSLIYSFLINPYSGETIEFAQNFNKMIVYDPLNAPGFRRSVEFSGLTELFSFFEKQTRFISVVWQSAIAGFIQTLLANISAYFLAKSITDDREFSALICLAMLSVFFGNLTQYPLYFPIHFFGWGQLGFYIFISWFCLWINRYEKCCHLTLPILCFMHPGFGLLGSGLVAFEAVVEKRYQHLGYVGASIATVFWFFGGGLNERNVLLDWSSNGHHIYNASPTNLIFLAIFTIFTLTWLTRQKKFNKKAKILGTFSIALLLAIYIFSRTPSLSDTISLVFYRAHFGRFFNLFLLLAIISFAYCLYQKINSKRLTQKGFLLLICLPIPIYIGIPHAHLNIFLAAMLIITMSTVVIITYQKEIEVKLEGFKKLLDFRLEFLIAGFLLLSLMPFPRLINYSIFNDVYNGDLANSLAAAGVKSVVTPGYVHGVDGLNVQLATNLPFWVPFPDNNGLYCNIKPGIDYAEYVIKIRDCFEKKSAAEWTAICKKLDTLAVLDFNKNGLSIPSAKILYHAKGVKAVTPCE